MTPKLPKCLPSLEGGKTTFGHQAVDPLVSLANRDIAGTSPLTEQFEPQDSLPISQHHKMAGMG